MLNWKSFVLALPASLMLVSCAGDPPALPAASLQDTPYVLAPGDKLHVTAFNIAAITGDYQINPSGKLDLPIVGPVPAKGNTAEQLADAIRAKLADGYLKDPRVSVEVAEVRPFYILGEVTKPGSYPYADDMTVQQAVATAGGFTYRANRRVVFIERSGDTKEYSVSLKGHAIHIRAGDTIRVGERYF